MYKVGRSRTPQGVRGLKHPFKRLPVKIIGTGRTPQGVRGLKHRPGKHAYVFGRSHSARSAWIETVSQIKLFMAFRVALRKECVD